MYLPDGEAGKPAGNDTSLSGVGGGVAKGDLVIGQFQDAIVTASATGADHHPQGVVFHSPEQQGQVVD